MELATHHIDLNSIPKATTVASKLEKAFLRKIKGVHLKIHHSPISDSVYVVLKTLSKGMIVRISDHEKEINKKMFNFYLGHREHKSINLYPHYGLYKMSDIQHTIKEVVEYME